VTTLDTLLRIVRADWSQREPKLVLADALQESGDERAAQLWRVIAEPGDDTHRLNYAAACERDGDAARAEFVRVQVALGAHERAVGRKGFIDADLGDGFILFSKREAMKAREWDLLSEHWREWFNRPGHVRLPERDNWSRGFVSRLTCSWADWRDHGDRIREVQLVEAVRLTDRARWGLAGFQDNDEALQKWLTANWPGITFELPPVLSVMVTATVTVGTIPSLRQGHRGTLTIGGQEVPITNWRFSGDPDTD
jgi:uncharacterized protein (TIGR02996 family)